MAFIHPFNSRLSKLTFTLYVYFHNSSKREPAAIQYKYAVSSFKSSSATVTTSYYNRGSNSKN